MSTTALTREQLDELAYWLSRRKSELQIEAAPTTRGIDRPEIAERAATTEALAWATIDAAQAKRDLDEIGTIDAALQRIDQGRYGLCTSCGEPIAISRLLAEPLALRCIGCQREHERRPG
jgi:DnaK suppressor protein